MSVGIICST
ncbi:hypothetical protein YPPY02_1720, partial [Yersinia pestis PY-02]